MTVAGNNPQSSITPEWCDIKAAAAHLGVSIGFLRKSVRLKRIPYARAGSKILRFRRADLDSWLERNGNGFNPEGSAVAR